jgi:hypothetical protein
VGEADNPLVFDLGSNAEKNAGELTSGIFMTSREANWNPG